MRASSLFSLMVLSTAVFLAPEAWAMPLCDEAEDVFEEVEQVVPCAMLEGGELGSWCPEAQVYVLTSSGVLLCSAMLPRLDTVSGGEELGAGRSQGALSSAPFSNPGCFLPAGLSLAQPLVRELQGALFAKASPFAKGDIGPPFVPG